VQAQYRGGLDGWLALTGCRPHTGPDEKPAHAVTRRPVPGSPFNRPTPAPQPVEEFEAHDLVTHDRYGLGRVIASEADTVLVDFGTVTYRISAPYAKLTRL
jgi:hypothetical protein